MEIQTYDIFNPNVSHVPRGLAGKTILVYGGNRTGKTKQGTRLPKPFYLGFEAGINGIAGVDFLPIQKWSDFIKVNKQLTDPVTLEKAKAKYQTILFDTVEASSLMCQDFVAQKAGASSIAAGNDGFGLWKEYEQEYFRQINLLASCGYTVYFISHEGDRKAVGNDGKEYKKIYPTGDKRSIDPVCNLVDIIGYARTNGIDSTSGEEIKSSLYLANSIHYHAGSRFDFLQGKIEEFTAENLEKAIADAVDKQATASDNSTVDYNQYVEEKKVDRLTFDEMKEQVRCYVQVMQKDEALFAKYKEIVEEHLGVNGSVMEANSKQEQQVDLILDGLMRLGIDI